MKNNALKKEEFSFESLEAQKAEIHVLQIVKQAEIACHMPHNIDAPDFEEFLAQYGNGIASDFA